MGLSSGTPVWARVRFAQHARNMIMTKETDFNSMTSYIGHISPFESSNVENIRTYISYSIALIACFFVYDETN